MEKVDQIIKDVSLILEKDYDECNSEDCFGVKEEIRYLIRDLRTCLYPEVFAKKSNISNDFNISEKLKKVYETLIFLINLLENNLNSEAISLGLIKELPNIKKKLELDVEAAYKGDPAAYTKKEIILSYPSFEALSIYRISHYLYEEGAIILSRAMSEYAHSITGIDINPGAKIGHSFFIDHGTGVVIGETCIIGDNVKIYQGVTLGALSFPKDDEGNIIKGNKRHPTIGNNVIIYANATVLGGDTVIGDNCVIGSNVSIRSSIAKNSTVLR